jgi:hypothetical protein
MSSTGYIKNGVYYKVEKIPMQQLVAGQQTMYKQGDHARQRFDHSAEILQPYNHRGEPNKDFIEASPEAAEDYGFLPRSTPAPEHAAPAEGSIAWGQQPPNS